MLTKYSPPRWNFRWCCKRLKERPFKRFIESIKEGKVLNLVGTRREEGRKHDGEGWSRKVVNEGLVYAAPLRDLRNDYAWALLREIWLELKVKWIYRRVKRSLQGSEEDWLLVLSIGDVRRDAVNEA